MKKLILCMFIMRFSILYSQNDTLTLYYEIGKYKLTESHKNKISNQLKKIDSTTKYHIEIVSSCDYLGSTKNNLILSSKRAENVRNLILQNDHFIISSIKYKGIG